MGSQALSPLWWSGTGIASARLEVEACLSEESLQSHSPVTTTICETKCKSSSHAMGNESMHPIHLVRVNPKIHQTLHCNCCWISPLTLT
ncbi:hypothetical protein V6N13_022056 [Hibiscus sabdariffa]|uniref:Uncharacterized protein n=1 Tax=Hibiscus sabdariffa TaxID=183260 RepID=A0ABR2CQH4_9ROSI